MQITIHTYIGHNSAAYAENLKKHCDRLKSGQHEIFYECYRTINHTQYKKTERIPIGWEHMADVNAHEVSSSYSHAKCIHRSIEEIEHSTGCHIIMDADTCITYKHWDVEVLEMLKQYDIFGWENKRGVPSVMFFAFHPVILDKMKLDFTPMLKNGKEMCAKDRICTPEEADVYKIELGEYIKCDTGWRIPKLLRDADLHYCCLKRVLGVDKESILPFKDRRQKEFCFKGDKNEHMCEWHLNWKLFGTHMQASRSFAFNSNRGKVWKSRIDMYMQKEHGFTI